MGQLLQPLDYVLFFGALIFAMAVGVIAGRREETSQDYFLAGKRIPWWGVAGSIFGSNVSANHMVGMMGIGFSIGFAQSHFELGAIAGLMLLCYGFLPVYRKLNLFTLSEYLGQRYDERSRVAYAVIMVVIMALVQMVPALYIGARSVCVLLGGDAVVAVAAAADAAASTADDGAGPVPTKLHVNKPYYYAFVIALGAISASYTIFGGLKAVVWTDVIQSVLLLAAGILVALLTFHAIGGWAAMMELDRAGGEKMHLYLPVNHPELPWTGVLSGLMAMHFFYWGTNQFIVQRALAARSDAEARVGIIAAGFLKLLIPFFAIAAGVAAYYLFQLRLPERSIAPDTAFTEIVRLVVPLGYGIVGLIAAGLIGAILSSIDSMMNSAATIVTVDIYKRYVRPQADDREMILVGRLSIVVFVIVAAALAMFVLDPNSEKNFFLQIANYQNYLTPGLLVAFALGMLWRRGTAQAAFVTILSGVFFSWLVEFGYNRWLGSQPLIAQMFGAQLNFFHRVVFVILLCGVIYVAVSLLTGDKSQKSRLVWADLGGHEAGTLKRLLAAIVFSIATFQLLAYAMVLSWLPPAVCAVLGGLWTLAMFSGAVVLYPKTRAAADEPAEDADTRTLPLWQDDRTLAGLLCALAVFMMYYFY